MTQQLEQTELIGARSAKTVDPLYLPGVEVLLVMEKDQISFVFSVFMQGKARTLVLAIWHLDFLPCDNSLDHCCLILKDC